MDNTFRKKERLCGQTGIARLLAQGRHGAVPGIKYCYAPGSGAEVNRILISVPKKLFRRAVKRNLLKRRIREAYRTRKTLLPGGGTDLMFVYATKELLSYSEICDRVEEILRAVAGRTAS